VRRTIQIALLGLSVGLLPSVAQAQWYPYPYPPRHAYPYWALDDLRSAVRVEVEPKDAEVYVDGYYAGIVDDFDGVFQRLRVTPGEHEIVVRRDGFHSLRENLYLTPDSTHHMRARLEPLAAGQPNEPPPTPTAPLAGQQPGNPGYPPSIPPMARDPRRTPARRMPPPEMPQEAPPPPAPMPGEPSASGALVIRVQPSDADITIDGEHWAGPQGEERLVVQLPEGTHQIEIRKDGFKPYSGSIAIRRGETSPLNVSLPPRE
jgi:hypothetical protein